MAYAQHVLSGLHLGLGYADALTKTIPADRFAEFPGKDVVCPAFYMGHLAIYPARALDLLGRSDLAIANPAGWDERFKAGVEAKPGDYPSKDAIMAHFMAGYRAVAKALETAPDEAFDRENPAEGRFKEMFPTVGGAVTFLCIGHMQMHLGQVSTWRRVMGLGSAV
jgi:hypothetical protein